MSRRRTKVRVEEGFVPDDEAKELAMALKEADAGDFIRGEADFLEASSIAASTRRPASSTSSARGT